ncbi:MAG: magnesium transporter [Thermodesulfovibrionales bacterium]|nr:magnesium transporter [Thermodesulfovibrionales bacterium]
MPLFGELFLSEIIRKPVYDPKGEIVGKVWDLIVVKGNPFPKISALIVERQKRLFCVSIKDINLFNKIIISTYLYSKEIEPYQPNDEDLLAYRDIIDKQIVDVNGAKVVKVNDIKLEGYDGDAVLSAVDIGKRWKFRRAGIRKVARLFESRFPPHLISWNYIQPLKPKLDSIALTVPRHMVSELHPADIAEIISQVSMDEGTHILKDLDVETAAEALSELEPEKQAEIISLIDTEKAADIIEEMTPDDAADLLGDLPVEKAKEILEHIEKEEAEEIQELLVHKEDTAGGVMTNEFIAYFTDTLVRDAIDRFKKDAEEIETVYYIYVIDENEKLVGVTSLRELLLADPMDRLSDIMTKKIITVSPDEDVSVISEILSKYNLVALPVVDHGGHLLGIVTVDDILDIIEKEATEDIYKVAGTSEIKYGRIEEAKPIEVVKSRIPWLILCLLGGLISSLVIGKFEETLTSMVVLAAFIPVIMGMAGNAGLQVSTTMVRSIALNSINNYWRYVGKEILSGFIIAITTGVIIAIAALLLKGMPMLGIVVGLSMFLSITSSTFLALLTPTLAHKVGIDPAVTAGPFVTVFNDILGLTIYFTVATVFMKFLI